MHIREEDQRIVDTAHVIIQVVATLYLFARVKFHVVVVILHFWQLAVCFMALRAISYNYHDSYYNSHGRWQISAMFIINALFALVLQ